MPGVQSRLKGRLALHSLLQLAVGAVLVIVTAIAESDFGWTTEYSGSSYGTSLMGLQTATATLVVVSAVEGVLTYSGWRSLELVPGLLAVCVGLHVAGSLAACVLGALTLLLLADNASSASHNEDMKSLFAVTGLAVALLLLLSIAMLRLEVHWAIRSWAEGAAPDEEQYASVAVTVPPANASTWSSSRPAAPPTSPRPTAPPAPVPVESELKQLVTRYAHRRAPPAQAFSSSTSSSSSSSTSMLMPGPPLEEDTVEPTWEAMAQSSSSFACSLRSVPAVETVVGHLTARGFYVIAAGAAGDTQQVLFHAYARSGELFMGRFEFALVDCSLAASFRCSGPHRIPEFVALFELQALLEMAASEPS